MWVRTIIIVASYKNYSQSTSRVTSISGNEINIQIPLCNVRHLNGMLDISLEIFPKKTNKLKKKKKDSKYMGNNKLLLFLKYLML